MSISEGPFSDVYILNFRSCLHGLNGHITAIEHFTLGMTSLDHQGSSARRPSGSSPFSSVILELLDDIDDIPDLHLQFWYSDNGTFVGKHSSVAAFLDLLSSKGPSHGLYINKKKCELLWSSGDIPFPEFPGEVIRINESSEGAESLRAPVVGSDSFLNQSFAKRVDNVLSCQDHLSDLKDLQVKMHLLCSCLSLCKINHLIRTVPRKSNRTT